MAVAAPVHVLLCLRPHLLPHQAEMIEPDAVRAELTARFDHPAWRHRDSLFCIRVEVRVDGPPVGSVLVIPDTGISKRHWLERQRC